MYTFLQLKTDLRAQIWPDGEAESLRASHDKSFIDAIIDLQIWVECQRQDNTQIIPQCATFYKCGLTVLDAPPKSFIVSLGVIDKINPDTGREDATAADDYCSLIGYCQVDACYIERYFAACNRARCCLPWFFGCPKPPVPTDEGLPAGLAPLALGYSYPQDSTDRTWGRAGRGVWAIERGKIYVAPWLQSTETIILRWDGIKREWADADEVDNDPLFLQAVRAYVQAQHAGQWDKDYTAQTNFLNEFNMLRAELMRLCEEENRVRDCEPSKARGSQGLTNLFYNDSQSATATCDAGTTGNPVTVTIPAGQVASAISKADANQIAQTQALTQARAQLVCVTTPVLYWNTPQTYIASCVQEEGAPMPDGNPVTRTTPAHTVSSSDSQQAADDAARALAVTAANGALTCTFWNRTATYTAPCTGTGTDFTATVAAHTVSSGESQADADTQGQNAAKKAADEGLPSVCTATVYHSQVQTGLQSEVCESGCLVTVTYTVTAGYATSTDSQAAANQTANQYGVARAQSAAIGFCALNQCGVHAITVP